MLIGENGVGVGVRGGDGRCIYFVRDRSRMTIEWEEGRGATHT